MILEAIYEDNFESCSHGFRPNRGCHTALSRIKDTFTGSKWFVEGDIKGFFDNIDHDILIRILEERISDNRFIRLIRKFLNAGYMENGHFIGHTVEHHKVELLVQYWLISILISSTNI